jgi:hypothetical protein
MTCDRVSNPIKYPKKDGSNSAGREACARRVRRYSRFACASCTGLMGQREQRQEKRRIKKAGCKNLRTDLGYM